MAATVRDLDTRLDDVEKSYTDFKARAELIILLGKWLAGFSAATVVSLIFVGGSALYSAGKLTAEFESQGKQIQRLNDKMDRLSQQLDDLRADIRKLPPKQ